MSDINDINDVNIFKNDFANDFVHTQHSRINRIKLLWGYLQFCKRLVNDFVNKPPKFGEIGQTKNVFKNHFEDDFANDFVNTQHSRINRIKLLWGYS